MVAKVTVSGNGSFEDNSIFGYSYTEDAMPTSADKSFGATSSLSLDGIDNPDAKDGNTRPSSRLLINNPLTLTDDYYGSVNGIVKSVGITAGRANVSVDPTTTTVSKSVKAAALGPAVPTTAHNFVKNPRFIGDSDFEYAYNIFNTSNNDVLTHTNGPLPSTRAAVLTRDAVSPQFSTKLAYMRSDFTGSVAVGTTYNMQAMVYSSVPTVVSIGIAFVDVTPYIFNLFSFNPPAGDPQTDSETILSYVSPTDFYIPANTWTLVSAPTTITDTTTITAGYLAAVVRSTRGYGNDAGASLATSLVMITEQTGPVTYRDGGYGATTFPSWTWSGSTGLSESSGPSTTAMSLANAFRVYLQLAGISLGNISIHSAYETIYVNLPGWAGPAWDYIKQLCAVPFLDARTTDLQVIGSQVIVQPAGLISTTIDKLSDKSFTVSSKESSANISIVNYNHEYHINRAIANPDQRFQVSANEIVTEKITVPATLNTVNQPVCVEAISTIPYQYGLGEYVILGSDELPIKPAYWNDAGGKVEVFLTENPNEIELKITGPAVDQIPGDGESTIYGPFKIGLESSGDGTEYPALFITGTGVFSAAETITYKTGQDDATAANSSAADVDNIFIGTRAIADAAGLRAAQSVGGPEVGLSITLPATNEASKNFGAFAGAIIADENIKMRVRSVSYTPEAIQATCVPYTTFADFDTAWSGKTFADFKAVMLDPVTYPTDAFKFHDFTVMPLIG